jgi:hypothetical protein
MIDLSHQQAISSLNNPLWYLLRKKMMTFVMVSQKKEKKSYKQYVYPCSAGSFTTEQFISTVVGSLLISLIVCNFNFEEETTAES